MKEQIPALIYGVVAILGFIAVIIKAPDHMAGYAILAIILASLFAI